MTRPRAIAWIALAALLLLMLALTLRWASQPSRVAGVILDQLGDALGLEITASGVSDYRVRGTPRIVVRDLVAREPGAATPVLRADRVYLSLPWSTLRARGSDLTVRRVELDAPQLDMAALQRWRASRPPSAETRVPTLTDGLEVVRGSVVGSGWSIDGIKLSLPSLHPDAVVPARIGGRLVSGRTRVPFDLHVNLTRPGFDAAIGAIGHANVMTASWRLPMRLTFSGRLHDDGRSLGITGFKLGANARYMAGDTDLPFVHGLAGNLRYADGLFTIAPLGIAVRGRETIPTFDARGRFAWQDAIALRLRGTLAEWPQAWPALPPPIGQSGSTLPFFLAYTGSPDLSGQSALQLRRDETRFDGRFRLPAVREWIDQATGGTPLPPIDGTLTAPALEIAGAKLEGIEIEFDVGDEPTAP